MKVFLFSMKKMHFCFAENYCLASRCKLYFPWCHCPSERGLLLLFPSTKSVIAWKRAYETLSHETFVLKIACEILTDEFSERISKLYSQEGDFCTENQKKNKIIKFVIDLCFNFLLNHSFSGENPMRKSSTIASALS